MCVALVVLTGCTASSRHTPPLPPRPQVVAISMREYRFVFNAKIHSGETLFRIQNEGTINHVLAMFEIPEDFPPLDEQLHGDERRSITPVVELPARRPGGTQSFVFDLKAGQRYGLICFLRDPDGESHARKGMNAEFRPPGPPPTVQPEPTSSIHGS